MGYDDRQIEELRRTIDSVPCDLALVGTPFDLGQLIESNKTLLRVSYEVDQPGSEALEKLLDGFLESLDR